MTLGIKKLKELKELCMQISPYFTLVHEFSIRHLGSVPV